MAHAADLGLIPDSSVPQNIQGALEKCVNELHEPLYLDAAFYYADGPVHAPRAPRGPCAFVGEGATSENSRKAFTSIKFPELGQGVPAVDPCSGAYDWLWKGMTIVGPSREATVGQSPADCDGARFRSQGRAEDIVISGFNHRDRIESDHITYVNLSGGGNAFGSAMPESNTGGFGDMRFYGCSWTGQKKASWLIHSNSVLGNAQFFGGHIGFSPVAFLRDGDEGGKAGQFLDFIVFHGTSFENVGNSSFLDLVGNGWMSTIHFFPHAEAGPWTAARFGGPSWDQLPALANIDVAHLRGVHWWGKPPIWDRTHPAIRCKDADGLYGIPHFGSMLSTVANGTGPLPIELVPGTDLQRPLKNCHFGGLRGGGGGTIHFHLAEEPIPQYDLVELGKKGVRRCVGGPNSMAAGTNGRAVAKGQAAAVIAEGTTPAVKGNNYTSRVIPAFTAVGPDPDNPGGIAPVDSRWQRPLARTIQDVQPGTPGSLDLTGVLYDDPELLEPAV